MNPQLQRWLGLLEFNPSPSLWELLHLLVAGAQPPAPEWGAMLSHGREYILEAPWVLTAPGVAILLVVVGFNLFGDGLRDVLDPRVGE